MGLSLRKRHRKWAILIACAVVVLFLDTFLQYNIVSSIIKGSDTSLSNAGVTGKGPYREIHVNSRRLREVEDMLTEKGLKDQIDMLTERLNLSVYYTPEPVYRTDLSLRELFRPDRWQQGYQQPYNQQQGSSPRPIMLNSYIKAGSSLLVDLVNRHTDTFYIPHPLRAITEFKYLTADNYICNSKTGFCRELRRPNYDSSEEPDKEMHSLLQYAKRKEYPLDTAVRMLRNIFTCSFDAGFDTLHITDLPYSKLGYGFKRYVDCVKDSRQTTCLNILNTSCNEHSVRMTKVLRLTLSAVENLLRTNENVHVLHLFRDPRAIIASRLDAADWYSVQKTQRDPTLTDDAHALCQKMTLDLNGGARLLHLFPDRFMFARFEDLVSLDRHSHIQNVLSFLKIKPDMSKADLSRNPFDWRKKLSFKDMRLVDAECGEMYGRLGYLKFHSEDTLRNFEFNSFLSV